MSIEINVETKDAVAEVSVAGTIDEQGAEQLKTALSALAVDSLREVRIDFTAVSFIGSSGIGKLLLFYKNIAVHGGRLEVYGLSAAIHELFLELKLDTIFTVRAA